MATTLAVLPPSAETDHLLPPPPVQSHNRILWGLGTVVSFGASSLSGYKAVMSFLASRNSDGGAFSLAAVVCAGACIYCCARIVISLRTKNIQPINTDHQMLVKIDNRLIEILQPEEDVELGYPPRSLYDSINSKLSMLQELLPDLQQKIEELQAEVQAVVDQQSPPGSPGAVNSSFERNILGKLDDIAARAGKDRLSRSASSSAASSPAGKGHTPPATSSAVGKRLSFGPINEPSPISSPTADEKK